MRGAGISVVRDDEDTCHGQEDRSSQRQQGALPPPPRWPRRLDTHILYSGGGGGVFTSGAGAGSVVACAHGAVFSSPCRGARRGFPGRHLPERLGHAIAPVYAANWCRGRCDSVEASPRMTIPAICITLMHPSISRSGSVVRGTAESSRRRTLRPWRAGSGASRRQADTAVSR